MKKNKKIFVVILCTLIFGIFVLTSAKYSFNKQKLNNEIEKNEVLAYNTSDNQDRLYLSDIDYIASESFPGWDEIRYDQINTGAKITLKVENSTYSFKKGIWAHATSQVVYDISSYNYRYFTAFVGLNTTSTSGDGVKFYIYLSEDGQNWGEAKFDEVKLPGEVASRVEIELGTANYIKLVANRLGNATADHAVYADAKLVNELNDGVSVFEKLEKYDEIIKNLYNGQTSITGELELTLLKRELVKRVGQFGLNSFYNESDENKAMLDWLIGDVENIREYILGGIPDGGSYYNSLAQLSRLYNEYKDDFELNDNLNNPYQPELTNGFLYKKMAITLSLTHSKTVSSWMNSGAPENQSDALRRYAIYRYMHQNNKFRKFNDESYGPMFEALRVEEMRLVLNNPMDDESILWLNEYTQDRLDEFKQDKWITPHPYIEYRQPNYNNPVFYDEANKDYFNELFGVKDKINEGQIIGLWDLEYTIPGGKTVPSYTLSVTRGTDDYKLQKVWMNFRNQFKTGAICGGISNSGSNIRAAHGIPAMFAYQPYHGVILNYAKDNSGRGFWGIDNNCDGWAYTSSAGTRFLLGWGMEMWNIESPLNTQWLYMFKYNAVYIQLGQEAINDYDNFVQSEELNFLADVYSADLVKKEEIYNKALEKQGINLDAWVDLINMYKADSAKTEANYYELAERIAENMKYFPLPMKHLSNLIKDKFTSPEYIYQFDLLQGRTLTEASQLPNTATDKVVQPDLTRGEAQFLLGRLDRTMATFSFDGEDAGKIVLSSRFDGSGLRFDYALAGKGESENWTKERFKEVPFTDTEEHKWQLTSDELASITAENDIYIHIVGASYSDQNVYKIDITEQSLPTNLYANDEWENDIAGPTNLMEWRYTENDEWTSYRVALPELTGNKTVQVRLAATGTKLPSVASEIYTFTPDKERPDNRKYISYRHLTIDSFISESTETKRPGQAVNAIDGNINTQWHTIYSQSIAGLEAFITIKLDEAKYISGLDYLHKEEAKEAYGFMKNGKVYVSEDGDNWIEAITVSDVSKDGEVKELTFDKPIYGQYVKLVIESYDNVFAAASMINLYEDITKPTAKIEYSPDKLTNKDVVATIVVDDDITITNNGGSKTYKFTKNDEFTFEFADKTGNSGYVTAKVDWIDKDAPTATIEYNIENKTEESVIATLKPSEEVTILGNGKDVYVFNENGEFTFEFVDKAGNKGTATAKVDWIEKKQSDVKPDDTHTGDDSNENNKPNDNTSNKPTDGNSNNNNPNENTGTQTKPEETYETLTSDKVTVKIPNSLLSKYKGIKLNYQALALSDAEKSLYGKDSESYTLSLQIEDEEINVSNIPLTQTIKLNPNKEFEAIYVIRENGSVVKLNSKVTADEIVFDDNGLGKYIVAYKSNTEEQPDINNEKPSEEEEEKSFNYIPYVVGTTVLLAGGAICFVIRKRNKH